MKKSTIIKRVLVIFFLVLILAVLLLVSKIDSIGRIAVEKGGTAALGVPVTMEKFHLSFIHGEVGLDNLQVNNPQGFNSEYLFKLGHLGTAVNISSITSDTIEIKDVVIKNMEITFEQKGMSSNLQALLDSLKSAEGQETPTQEPTTTEEQGTGKKLQLNRFYIEGAKVHVKLLPLPGQKSDFTIGMEPMTIENISSDSDKGEMTAMVVRKVVIAVAQSIIKAISQDIPAALLEGLQGSVNKAAEVLGAGAQELLKGIQGIGDVGLKGAGEIIKGGADAIEATGQGLINAGGGAVNQIGKTGEDALKTIGDAGKGVEQGVKDLGKGLEDAGKGLKDLFNNKDKEKTTE